MVRLEGDKEDVGMIQSDFSTNGRTVWINAPHCIARFCPLSGEIYPSTIIRQPWEDWVVSVKARLGIEVPQSLKPDWCKR